MATMTVRPDAIAGPAGATSFCRSRLFALTGDLRGRGAMRRATVVALSGKRRAPIAQRIAPLVGGGSPGLCWRITPGG